MLEELGFAATWQNLAFVEDNTNSSAVEEGLLNFGSGSTTTGATGASIGRLGMYVSGAPDGAADATGWGGGWVEHGGGFGVTDTAGLLAPGTTMPSFRATDGTGGITGSYDASRFLPANQGLRFSGFFQYDRNDLSMPGFGTAQMNDYSVGGSVFYNNGPSYLRGAGLYEFGPGSETNTLGASTGDFNHQGYAADLKLGYVFLLANTMSSATPVLPTKAPPKPPSGGYGLGLDVSSHVGYSRTETDSFTDTAGLNFGTGDTHFGDGGAGAKLFAYVPRNGLV
jgi:hypothetical protein